MQNMQNIRNDLWQKTSFSTCSYIKSLRDYRPVIVRRAIQSWTKLLELPFAEKIFLGFTLWFFVRNCEIIYPKLKTEYC
ncbi:MAG: hypothetical protein V7K40_14430 [Nostoc sp.]